MGLDLPTVLFLPLASFWFYLFAEFFFWNGWCMSQVILSWYWCIFCMEQSVWFSMLLNRCFECIVRRLARGVLVCICLNLQVWYVIVNNLFQINCLRGILRCWNLLLFTCWWLCEVLGWFCLRSLKWKFLQWGRCSWMIFMQEIHSVDIKNICIVWYIYDIEICLMEYELFAIYSWIPVVFHAKL